MTKSPSTKAISELLPQGSAKTRRARQAAKTERTLKVVPEPEQNEGRFVAVKDGRKWYVHDVQLGRLDDVGSFKTRHEAETEAAANQADFDEAKASVTPDHKQAERMPTLAELGKPLAQREQPGYTTEQIAAMTRTERLVAAKAEIEALRTWRNDGRPVKPGDGPATPVLDWMTDPASKPAQARSAAKAPARTPEQDKMIAALITSGRQCEPPVSWAKIAEQIEAQAIPTNRGGKWYDTTVSDYAKKLALV